MNKLAKKEFLFRLMKKGWNEKQAEKLYADFVSVMETALLNGENVSIKGIGTITAEVLDAGTIKLFGKEKSVGKRLKIGFKVSRILQKKYAYTNSEEYQKSLLLKKFRKNL